MKPTEPTDDQLHLITEAYVNGPDNVKFSIKCAILHWESIRPPCSNCGDVKAALPEWIPVSVKPIPDLVVALHPNGLVNSYRGLEGYNPTGFTHYMKHETLAALPKRQIPVKVEPTAEEVERAEFEAWWSGSDNFAATKPVALLAWKAARAGR